MDYSRLNKEAWEEAFDHRSHGWCEDIINRLKDESYPFLGDELVEEIQGFDLQDKTVGQFCCNNGRELLSVMKFGAEKGVGFDIAENMVAWANEIAGKTKFNCSFVATDVNEIDKSYHNYFDFIFITIGAITWFRDLSQVFKKVSLCLKTGGFLIINDMHPVTNMLAFVGEENYDENFPNKMINSYFKEEPWIENKGMGYMCQEAYDSKAFYSFSHTLSSVVNSLLSNGLIIAKLREFQQDISGSLIHLDNQGIPLSYILVAKKLVISAL